MLEGIADRRDGAEDFGLLETLLLEDVRQVVAAHELEGDVDVIVVLGVAAHLDDRPVIQRCRALHLAACALAELLLGGNRLQGDQLAGLEILGLEDGCATADADRFNDPKTVSDDAFGVERWDCACARRTPQRMDAHRP